jgi:uncharacterized damage-inducible protein DinB
MAYYNVVKPRADGWGWETKVDIPPSIRQIVSSIDQMKRNIEHAVEGLADEQVWVRPGVDVAAIGNLLLHLRGTEHHWIGHKIGCRALHRDIHKEFATRGGMSLDELMGNLQEANSETEEILSDLTEAKVSSYRSEDGLSIPFILHYVSQHLALHLGQIVVVREYLSPGYRLY